MHRHDKCLFLKIGNHSTVEAVPIFFQERSLETDVALMYSRKVAQPVRRIKDKRLHRVFGILDTTRWLCFGMVKWLLPTPVKPG